MTKVFTIQFDNAISYWDSSNNLYVPRPHTIGLIKTLSDMGSVALYSNSSKYLVDAFLYEIYKRKTIFDVPMNVYTSISPYMMPPSNDIMDIHSIHAFVDTRYQPKYTTLSILPPSPFGEYEDTELLTLSGYLKRKIVSGIPFTEMCFEDWEDRVRLIQEGIEKEKGA